MRCLNLVQFFFERKNEYHFSNVWMNKLYKLYESEDGIWRCDCLHVGRFDHLTTQRQIFVTSVIKIIFHIPHYNIKLRLLPKVYIREV